ncbi:hypothetical protein L6261_03755 [Candidatus Parcubacteria bacterium]|nr:hypothetical protein [Candidatus Parcubacteria bacterium]
MSELNFKKIKKFFSFAKGLDIGSTFSWIVLFVFFVLLNIGIAIFSIYLYVQISRGGFFNVAEEPNENTKIIRISKSKLTKIISSFEEKSKRFEELKKQKPNYVIDPSL